MADNSLKAKRVEKCGEAPAGATAFLLTGFSVYRAGAEVRPEEGEGPMSRQSPNGPEGRPGKEG